MSIFPAEITLQQAAQSSLDLIQTAASVALTLAGCYGMVKAVTYLTKEDKDARSNLSQNKLLNTGKNILIEHDNVSQSALSMIAEGYKMINEATMNKVNKRLKEIKAEFGSESDVYIHLRTPGGDLFFAMLIAHTISEWKGRVIAHIHSYSASGGTLIALACNEIHMNSTSVLGPIDPQAPAKTSYYSVTDFLQIFGINPTTIDENFDCKEYLIPLDTTIGEENDEEQQPEEQAKKQKKLDEKKTNISAVSLNMQLIGSVNLMRQYKPFVERILRKKNKGYTEEQIASIVKNLLTDRDHSSPLFRDLCQKIGLNVVFDDSEQ